MYGRAPRVIYLPLGSTSPAVGPGSYDAHEQRHKKSDCYAPFLSLCNRESIFTKSDNEISLPGPGQYDSPHPKGNVLGGQSLKNRSRRFEEVVSEVPGPGAYDVLPCRVNPARAESVPPGGRSQREGVSKRLKFVAQSDIPSIPSPGQALGYEESSQGLLCRHTAPPQDHTLGPAFYTPATDHGTSQRYKGVHFGRMTGKRMEMRVLQGPGPGDYEPEKETTVEYKHVNMRREQHRRAELVIPRYHDILPLQEEKRGVPGPGQYHIKSQFEKTSSPYTASSPPFLSKAQRFCPVKERAPPVGVYEDPRCALELLNKTTGMKRSPFGLTAVRFSHGNRRDDSPGPGSYNVFAYGLARDSLRRACLGSSRKGAFGSVAQRSSPFHIRHEDQPGPGQYKVEEKTEEFYKKQHTAVFKSLTERLTMPLLAKPSPCSYDVGGAFERRRGQRSFTEPRSEDARKRQSSFLSAAPRHASFLQQDPSFPGPGQYSPGIPSSPQTGVMVSREDRFREPRNTTPGPGTYQLGPAIMDTVLKGTFNVTLHNPLIVPRAPLPHHQSTVTTTLALSST